MSAPNEPGYPRSGESPGGGNGSPGRSPSASGPGAEGGDVPPWQRGRQGARPPQGPARPQETQVRPDATRPPGAEARATTRFPTSGTAPTEETQAPVRTTERVEAPRPESRPEPRPESRPEAYASELPDLSGPVPRPGQRKPGERPASEPANRPAPRTQVSSRPPRGPVRASMQIRRVDPWSALKVSLVLSVALFFVWMIAVAFLYLVLGGMGVWDKLNSNVGDLLTSTSGASGGELVSSGTIFGGAALIGLVNIVILSAMATAGAFIYNLTTDLVGGVEVTLADRD
ncbi:hypothetical protein A5757_22595 [Mycobacterium sp. 852013-51886_SCH5428379]|uniref:DUF3566 domain-containing protein n=1 Tax=Mycobacterium sp. 852013-51886_SCH5428379 TaxID=1834111 RepID=UPI0007FE7D03|nr:DUF3566 domain-containing protein [Mycobacterium sp. 852013-51886_SCH5428379]OBB56415.1 hypothetical protein A5757_22595 [Mycobacterium sp. 852013-51886_SCH5428379]